MKVTLNVDANNEYEDEIVINVKQKNESISNLYQKIRDLVNNDNNTILLFDRKKEIILDIESVYFFETESDSVFAHTKNNSYLCKLRLYELTAKLPEYFVRISKSTIINITHVLSIEKKLSSSSLVQFNDCHKEVYISRRYFKNLKQIITERSFI